VCTLVPTSHDEEVDGIAERGIPANVGATRDRLLTLTGAQKSASLNWISVGAPVMSRRDACRVMPNSEAVIGCVDHEAVHSDRVIGRQLGSE
jgi:hypothetical protein